MLALASAALLLLALAPAAEATCGRVTCQTQEEFLQANCNPVCDVVRTVTKAKNTEDGCCPVYKCVTNPRTPCCGRTCAANTLAEANTQCNIIIRDDPVLNNLTVEYGAQFAVLRREAKPNKGKCCPKYECQTDADQLCANIVAKTPCENAAKCPRCFDPVVTLPANPDAGRCCPTIECQRNAQCLCDNKGANCPVPTCDPVLETIVQLFEANPEQGRCCPVLACQQNNTAICLAERVASPERLNLTCSDSCQIPVITREANFERLRCFDEYTCVDDPSRPCCRVNITACPAAPDCQATLGTCGVLSTRVAEPFEGRCCDRFSCSVNQTCICENTVCESAQDYEARVCTRDEEVYVKKEVRIEEGRCCAVHRCRLTPEAKLRQLQEELGLNRRRRRRRRSRRSVTEAPATTSP